LREESRRLDLGYDRLHVPAVSPRVYLAAQSALIVVWWATLALVPSTRDTFAPPSVGGMSWLLWFLPADIVTVVGGLLAAGWWRAYAGRLGLVLALIGISTQTLACITVPFRTAGEEGWIGAGLMLAASIATLACAGALIANTRAASGLFRAAPRDWTTRQLAMRTLWQSALLWPLFLIVLPWALSRVERAAGWQPPSSTTALMVRLSLGATLMIWAGIVNVATARAMVQDGAGTPLPVCMANRLVTRGPYARLRNPMCVSALLQGMSVAILLASPLTAAYVVLGGIVWEVLIRPAEERDLSERFGGAYDDYRSRVRCWWPTLRKSDA
jgi:protein-S-isoprenylcysteine O-methyltransferase Ste14